MADAPAAFIAGFSWSFNGFAVKAACAFISEKRMHQKINIASVFMKLTFAARLADKAMQTGTGSRTRTRIFSRYGWCNRRLYHARDVVN